MESPNKRRGTSKRVELEPITLPRNPLDTRCESPSAFKTISDQLVTKTKKRYPRLQTLDHLVELHVQDMYHGDFIQRSRERWNAFENRPLNYESDAARVYRLSRESATLVIQSAWRRSTAVRTRTRLVKKIWQQQINIARWITRDTVGWQILLQSVYTDGLRALSTSTSTCMGMILSGAYYQLPSIQLTYWLRFACTIHQSRSIRRNTSVLHTIDIQVRRVLRVLASLWKTITELALLRIQCVARSFLARRLFKTMLVMYRKQIAAIQIQCFYRRVVARRIVTHLQAQKAALRIQCYWRGYDARKRVHRHRVLRSARQYIVPLLSHCIHVVSLRRIHQAALIIQKLYRGRQARAHFRFLLCRSEEKKWQQNPSKGYIFFDQKRYTQAAVYLERCFLEGIYQDAPPLESLKEWETQENRSMHNRRGRTALRYQSRTSRLSFCFSTAPIQAHSVALHAPPGVEAAIAQLKFWLTYALAHYHVHDATGDLFNLHRAQMGFETYLRLDKQVHASEKARLEAQFRRLQCIYWSGTGDPRELLTGCVELLSSLESIHPWRHQVIMMMSMLYWRLNQIKQSWIQLETLLHELEQLQSAPDSEILVLRFILAKLLLEDVTQHFKKEENPLEDQELQEHEVYAAKLLQRCYQTIELWPSVGYFYGQVSSEQATVMLRSDHVPIGAFLLHQEMETSVLLKIKQSEDKISSLRIHRDQDGQYSTKRLAHTSFSLHEFLHQLPSSVHLDFASSKRRSIVSDTLFHALSNTQKEWVVHKQERLGRMLAWDQWQRRVRENRLYHPRRNETWSVVCLTMAQALEQNHAYDFSIIVAREGLAHTKDRSLRSCLNFLIGRVMMYLHRPLESAVAMQQIGLERTKGILVSPSLPAIQQALARYRRSSQGETFEHHLERVSKLERMCVKAWNFYSFSPNLRGQPLCEAVLLQRIEEEEPSQDPFFLQSLLRAHLHTFLLTRHLERVHLEKAQACIGRLIQSTSNFDPVMHRPHLHQLLLAWQQLPLLVCLEITEIYYHLLACGPVHVVIEMYESLYGRICGKHPRSSRYVAYQELCILRLAFLHAQRETVKSLKRSIQLIHDHIHDRSILLPGPIRRMNRPFPSHLPLDTAQLYFLRGFFYEQLEELQGIAPHQRRCWHSYQVLHTELQDRIKHHQVEHEERLRSGQVAQLHQAKGIRIFIGETKDIEIADLLHAQPFVMVQIESSMQPTRSAPMWTSLSPSWNEYIEGSIQSSNARIILTIRNQTTLRRIRKPLETDGIGQIQFCVKDLILSCPQRTIAPKYYDLVVSNGKLNKKPRIRLGFEFLLDFKEKTTQKSKRMGMWDMNDMCQHVQGGIGVFIASSWIWSTLGHVWLQNHDHLIALVFLRRAIREKERRIKDLMGVATCYRALRRDWESLAIPLLEEAHTLLKSSPSIHLVTELEQLRSREPGPFTKEMGKYIPASSHWILMRSSTRSYYLNQDTGMQFTGVDGVPSQCEPLEYEPLIIPSQPSHRVVHMTPDTQARVQSYCTQQQRLHAADPNEWIAIYNPHKNAMQFYSIHHPSQMKQPSTYAMLVDEYTMYHLLLVQDTYRQYHFRRQRQRRVRGVWHCLVWWTRIWLSTHHRFLRQEEIKRKESLNCLHVVIERATDLRVMDLRTSDPFVVAQLTDWTGTLLGKGQTSVKLATLHPVWNEEFEFEYRYTRHERDFLRPSRQRAMPPPLLTFTVYDYDLISLSKDEISLDGGTNKNDFLGLAVIPIEPLEHGKCVTTELKLRDEDGYDSPRSRGVLTITIQWKHVQDDHKRRHAIQPDLLIRPKKKSIPKPDAKTIEEQLYQMQSGIEALINTCRNIVILIDQLLKLYKRVLIARKSPKTNEEAIALKQRLQSIMKGQFEQHRRGFRASFESCQVCVTSLYHDMSQRIREYVDSCDVQTTEIYMKTIESIQSKMNEAIQCAKPRTVVSPYDLESFALDIDEIIRIRHVIVAWRYVITHLLQEFFVHVPEWSNIKAETSVLEQMEKLSKILQSLTNGHTTETPVSSDPSPSPVIEQTVPDAPIVADVELKPKGVKRSLGNPKVVNPAVAKRLERAEKERLKQERAKRLDK